jgi:AcrR family transcriptional regulator
MTPGVEIPPRRGRPPENREKLLQAALDCLRDRGYARTTARDLAAASGANLASIGYHFGSKEALLNEAIAEGMARWTAEVQREVFADETSSPRERLERAFASMVDRFDELEGYLVAFVEGFPPALRDDALRAVVAAAYERIRVAGAAMLTRVLREAGMDLDERRARAMSSLVIAICDGLILQWLLDPDSTPSSEEVVGALSALAPVLADR